MGCASKLAFKSLDPRKGVLFFSLFLESIMSYEDFLLWCLEHYGYDYMMERANMPNMYRQAYEAWLSRVPKCDYPTIACRTR